jgi:hypothetical protein
VKEYKYFLERSEEYIGKFANRDIIDTKHSLDRFNDDDRFNVWSGKDEFKSKIVDVAKKAIAVIYKKYKDTPATYGIHSKSTGIGMIVDWRDDDKHSDGFNDAIITTILPIKKHHFFKKDDVKIIVEKQIEEGGRIMYSQKFNENILKEDSTSHTVYYGENTLDWYVVFWEGRLHDYPSIDNFILVS